MRFISPSVIRNNILLRTRRDEKCLSWPVPRLKWYFRKFTTAGFGCYCGDVKERIHLFCCSDAQPCRMSHNGRNGTDVNRGRVQVGLTCTYPANETPRFSASAPLPGLSLVLRRVDTLKQRGAASQLHRGKRGERGGK